MADNLNGDSRLVVTLDSSQVSADLARLTAEFARFSRSTQDSVESVGAIFQGLRIPEVSTQISTLGGSIMQLDTSVPPALTAFERLRIGFNAVRGAANRLASFLPSLGRTFAGSLATVGVVSALAGTARSFERVTAAAIIASDSVNDYNNVLAFTANLSAITGQSQLQLTRNYEILSNGIRGLGFGTESLRTSFTELNRLFSAAGLSASQTADAINVLNRVAITGTVTTQDISSLSSTGLPAQRLFNEALGVTTQGFRELVMEGVNVTALFQGLPLAVSGLTSQLLDSGTTEATDSFARLRSEIDRLRLSIGESAAGTGGVSLLSVFTTLVSFITDRLVPALRTIVDFYAELFSPGSTTIAELTSARIGNIGETVSALEMIDTSLASNRVSAINLINEFDELVRTAGIYMISISNIAQLTDRINLQRDALGLARPLTAAQQRRNRLQEELDSNPPPTRTVTPRPVDTLFGRARFGELSTAERDSLSANALSELQDQENRTRITSTFQTIRDSSQELARGLGDTFREFFENGEINLRNTLGNALNNIGEIIFERLFVQSIGNTVSDFFISTFAGAVTGAIDGGSVASAGTTSSSAGSGMTMMVAPLAMVNSSLNNNSAAVGFQVNSNSNLSSALDRRFGRVSQGRGGFNRGLGLQTLRN